MGHNGVISFGLTLFFGPDEEDLYVYEMSPGDPELYRYQDGWERVRVREERVKVKGAPDQTLTLRFTRHGPIVYEDHGKRRAYAVRSVWFEPGAAPYLVSLSAMRAKSYAEFTGHMKRWAVPAVNQVYADIGGDIAWTAAGYSPIRPNWDGLLPVPGDGRFEWAGFLRAGDLPSSLNPQAGRFATANEMNVPAGWSVSAEEIGFEWIEGSRARRIREVFATTRVNSVQSSCDLQTDVMSLPARRLLTLLVQANARGPNIAEARALFERWDAMIREDSAAAALFEVWWAKHLRPAVIAAVVEDRAVRPLLAPGDPDAILSLLEHPHGRLKAPAAEARDKILMDSLASAYGECSERMGPSPAEWRWGRLHHGYFEHALTKLTGESGFDVGPLPMGGSDSTPMNAMFRFSDFRVTLGASVRMVIDVGGWDNSRCINTPGQSGDPRSPHYADLAPAWSRGEYVPLLYSAAAVEAAAKLRIALLPSGALTP
jgi:penicillin amidase